MNDPITSLSMALHKCRGQYAVLLGSGISRTSGIPTGWEIVLDLVRQLAAMHGEDPGTDPAAWYEAHEGEQPSYSKLLHALARSPEERCQLMRSYFEPTHEERRAGIKTPTRAHEALARLASRDVLKVFLTTNFDRLLEEALQRVDIIPAVIDTPDKLEGTLPLRHLGVAVVKLHGDYRDTRIKNTPEELSHYDPAIDALLDRVLDDYGLIVCGWSAEWDTALRRAFERSRRRRYTTYWANPRPLSAAAEHLLEARCGVFVPIEGADEFFSDLATKVTKLDKQCHHLTGTCKPAQAQFESKTQRIDTSSRRRVPVVLMTTAALVLIAFVLWMTWQRLPGSPARLARVFDPAAVEAVDHGVAIYDVYDQENVSRAGAYFAEAIALDPDCCIAYSWQALMMWLEWDRQWSRDVDTLNRAYELALRGVRLCPKLSETHRRLGWIALYREHLDEAEQEERTAIDLDPSNADAIAYLAQVLNFAGRPNEAIKEIRKAKELNPHYPAYYAFYLGHSYYLLGDTERAIAALEDAVPRGLNLSPVHRLLAILYANKGHEDKARREVDEVLRISPNACLEGFRLRLPYRDRALADQYIEGLKQAGFPSCSG